MTPTCLSAKRCCTGTFNTRCGFGSFVLKGMGSLRVVKIPSSAGSLFNEGENMQRRTFVPPDFCRIGYCGCAKG
jgi:hypothetical protein